MTFRKRNIGLILTGILMLSLLSVMCTDSRDSIFHSSSEEVKVSPLAHRLGFTKDRPLVMGMNTSYAPLQYVDEKGTPMGYDVEFTNILMHRLGIPFAFSPNHWDKMSPGILSGKYDMGMMVYSPYRKDLTNYSNAVFRMYYQIAYRKKEYSEFDFRHLKGKCIAYMKSRPIGLMLRDAEAEGIPITDLNEAFTDLANGKYDGLICYRFQATHNITHLHLQGVLQADELSLEPREYCYASSSKELIDSINAELKRMEDDGIIEEIYGKEVMTRFGAFRIPAWVWLLVGLLFVVFLFIFSINRYLLSRRLQAAFREVSEKNEALRIANQRAEESMRMKSTFIKQISHEIRTPLNILSGFTQVLTSPKAVLTDDERAEASEEVQKNTKRITGLINKMLELSEISSHTVLERSDTTTSLQIAQQAVHDSGIEEAAHIEFRCITEPGADTLFQTHLRSAARILELLLDNAIKFTRPAEALLPLAGGTKKEQVTLTVSHGRFVLEDTGVGIPPEESEHIFDEFVQLDEYYDGTGIGLTSARNMARNLGGDVILDTSYSDGARFVFTLGT